jgi:flagellar protein FliT
MTNDLAPADGCSRLLRCYAVLESASEEMLRAARTGDWDSVCRLEAACAVVIAQLRQLAQEHPLPPHEQGERLRILRSILANDAAIRRISQALPEMIDIAPDRAAAPAPAYTLH